MTGPVSLLTAVARRTHDLVLTAAGGPARARVVLTLAAVLGLSGADTGTITSTENNLEHAFHVGNTQIGILLSVVALAGAAFTIPMGVLVDRVNRVRLLTFATLAWAVAVLFSGAATSYLWLLAARVALGTLTAVAAPAVASLTGDFFPAGERGRIYGLIVGGDILGNGIGFLISGEISSVLPWRLAFWWLVVPSLALAWIVWRLSEPARGGQSQLQAGAQTLDDASGGTSGDTGAAGAEENIAVQAARREQVRPRPELVLHGDPSRRPTWWAIRYVLRVRTNVVLILASAIGYFYFYGMDSFAANFTIARYRVSKPEATLLVLVVGAGVLAGVYVGGRFADRLLRRGHVRARIAVPAACLLVLPAFLGPGFATTSVAIALPLLIAGAFLLGAPQPPIDAARLDIMPAQLWGRAEGIRTALRSVAVAAAPALFGYMSQYVFGGAVSASPGSAAGSGSGGTLSQANAGALAHTFLVFLVLLVMAGLLALFALRTYPQDLATAAASAQAIRTAGQAAGPASDESAGDR